MNRFILNQFNFVFVLSLLMIGFGIPSADAFEPFQAETITRVNLRFSPNTTGEILVKLSSGEPLTVLGFDNQWHHVIAVKRNIFGWVFGNYIKKIDHPITDSSPYPVSSISTVSAESSSVKPTSIDRSPIQTSLETKETVSVTSTDLYQPQIHSNDSPDLLVKSESSTGIVENGDGELSAAKVGNDFQFSRDDNRLSDHAGLIEKASTISRLMMKLSLALLSMMAFFLSYQSSQIIRKFSNNNPK
ncbi:MAG: SH3 domain-containing protein [Desulfatirhabdiaceae bacterium]